MNQYDRTPYENAGATVTPERERVHDHVERAEKREMLMRFILPLMLALITLAAGYSLGWNAGRNDLLEETYVQDRGSMIDRNGVSDRMPGPGRPDGFRR